MRSAFVLVLFAAASLALGVATALAGPGGNSGAAHQCQHGGWKHLVRANGTPFKNTGACVSYAAHGGTLTAPTPTSKPSTPSTSKPGHNPGGFDVVTNKQP